MARSTYSDISNQPRTPLIAAGRKRKRTVDDDEDIGCVKRVCTFFIRTCNEQCGDSSDEGLFSDCGFGTDEHSTPSSPTSALSQDTPRTPISLDPSPFLSLPNRPEIFFDTYDEEFGEKVSRHYELEQSLEKMLHGWRIRRYGKTVAEMYRRNHTPEHLREEYYERMDRLEKELEASDTDDD